MGEAFILAQRLELRTVFQEILQFLEAGIFGRAEQARDREGAAGVGPGSAGFKRLILEPAAQEAGHEGIACPQHIVNLDGKTLADNAVLDACRNCAGIDDAAHGAALQDDHALRKRADLAQCCKRVLGATGDVHFFLGADDEIAVGEDRLQMGRDLVGLDVAFLAGAVACKAPEIGAVIDVDDDPAAKFAGDGHGLALGGIGVGPGKMRACDEKGARGCDEILIDIAHIKGTVGAIVTIEDERKGFVALDREQHQGSQALRIGGNAACRDTFALHLLEDEAAHLLVTHPGDEPAPQAKAGGADGNVGG